MLPGCGGFIPLGQVSTTACKKRSRETVSGRWKTVSVLILVPIFINTNHYQGMFTTRVILKTCIISLELLYFGQQQHVLQRLACHEEMDGKTNMDLDAIANCEA